MLKRLTLRDFIIVQALEVDLTSGFTALTGETGAGKSILIDALQLTLGARADASVVREGASRAELCAEFDTPTSLKPWLQEAGFDAVDEPERLLLRRVIDAQGKSRAWINGSPASAQQLRETADHLVDIHGQHAWQALTRPSAVRALLDGFAGVDARALANAFEAWAQAGRDLAQAQAQQAGQSQEADRLLWQIDELDKLAPAEGEWDELNDEHRRLSNAQALLDAARTALNALSEAEVNAQALAAQAVDALEQVSDIDPRLAEVAGTLQEALVPLQDAARSLSSYLHQAELDPARLQTLDERLSAWMSLARRHRRPAAELPQFLSECRAALQALQAASDTQALQARVEACRRRYDELATHASTLRHAQAPSLAAAVTQGMRKLGMPGGRFDVDLPALTEPQSFGYESVEFLVAGHEGSTPRPLAKVASGGELSRIALAIAISTRNQRQRDPSTPCASTLIFDEVDSGVGGAVAESVGRLMRELGRSAPDERQVLAVTHLPQVAACAQAHLLVSKTVVDGRTLSQVQPIEGPERVQEIARMLGGEQISAASLAHAQEMLRPAPGSPTAPALAPAPQA
jgi:DNA repair protein RecN (Recombination protein N)